ncbi:MAG: hypothetical protein QW594_00875 [Candidatus Woesearchaeota archaeon]
MKAQFALEHLLVVGIGLLVLVPGIYFFYSNSLSQTNELQHAQLYHLGNTMKNEAESLYVLGPPSKSTLIVSFPEGIENISINDQEELIFTLKNDLGQMVFLVDVPINGIYYETLGQPCSKTCFQPGQHQIIFIALPQEVAIFIK